MIRIFTYVTLDADGEPTAAGTAYDLDVYNIATPMGNNYYESPLRNGNVLLTYDTKTLYEVQCKLNILANYVGLRSLVMYLGDYRYLGPNLYHHFKYHMPIVIYHVDDAPKAYVCRILKLDEKLAAQATLDDTQIMHLSAEGDRHDRMMFVLHISLSGTYTDIDDITSGVWESRV